MSRRVPGLHITWGRLLTHASLVVLVVIWTVPTLGLFVSSLRDKDQLIVSGWWTAFTTTERSAAGRIDARDAVEVDGLHVVEGSFLEDTRRSIVSYGVSQTALGAFAPGETIDLDGTAFTLNEDGSYRWVSEEPFAEGARHRIFHIMAIPPTFALTNYREVLASESIDRAFINTFTVTIPATLIPILIAAFAAYAFAWMKFPGRQWLFALVVGLLVVPLQMSLIPLLRMYNDIGATFGVPSKTYLGIWLAHTGFGLPLAIYLLRNYIGGLPRDIIESAQLDGASHFDIFIRLILPLSVPALASFAIFQFLWVWNDLLVALVFLGKDDDQIVLTSRLRELLGSRGDNWEILTSSAFISILVPLMVFFALQRYFVRGLLAGSVKGG
ncbi:MAG: carbohydrate ABC transporter permease [Trueperaceae bacterium]